YCSQLPLSPYYVFFFFHDPPTTEIYTLSLHDALPIWRLAAWLNLSGAARSRPVPGPTTSSVLICAFSRPGVKSMPVPLGPGVPRSEEHTSELQSRSDLVCRLLLEKKKKKKKKSKHNVI